MKKISFLLFITILLFFTHYVSAQNTREIIINSTGYGFDLNSTNGVAQWDYIQKFANITHNGQNASVTAVRLYVDWTSYEPTEGNYQRTKFRQAVEAILSLNSNTMKIAFHFPYQLNKTFIEDPNTWASPSDMAYTHNGLIAGDHFYRAPSLYNTRLRNKFYDFVSDALNQISDYYGRVLYVEAGNGNAEEFGQPYALDPSQNNYHTVALHDSWAATSWRTEYLPCRYPGQSTVTWGGNTYNISSAPLAGDYGSHYSNWNTDHAREFHRFGSWGIQRFYRGLRDVVKSKSNNIKVLYFCSDFGSMQGNLIHFHNAQLPMDLEELDGIYTSEADLNNIQEKIMALDVIKGTDPNKIAAIEFDPTDLGQEYAPNSILPNIAEEWFARAYKHGADYIHLAMHFTDDAIAVLKPALAMVRANYINGYTPPARQTAVNANVFPNVFTGNHLFKPTWNNLNGNNWSVTDNNPVSINMIDDGYWENIWSCTPTDPCTFTIVASGPTGSVNTNSSVTLNVSCTGSQCTGVTYSWSGNGISGSGNSVNFNAPGTPGSYTYTVTASKSGCSNKTDTVNITVVESGGGPCDFTEKGVVGTWNGLQVQTRQFTINGQLKWTLVILESTPVGADRHFPRGKNFADRQDITWTNGPVDKDCLGTEETGWGGLGFPSGITIPNGYIQDTMPDGAIFFELDEYGVSCNFNVNPSASPTQPTEGGSVTLNANCTGADCGSINYAWSGNGISGSNNSINFNAPGTAGSYTYTVTASKTGCSNKSDTVNITVVGSGANCPSIEGDMGTHCYHIEGWVYDPNHPNDVLYIDIYDGSTLIEANYPAGDFRQDLLDAGKGNGYHGFVFSTEGTVFRDGNPHNVVVKLAGCNDQIPSSPKSLSCEGMPSVLGEYPNEAAASKAKQLRVFPNPSNGTFEASFYLETGKKATIVLTDLQGRTLFNKVITGNGTHVERINVGNKATSTLFLRLIKNDGVEVKKINIVR